MHPEEATDDGVAFTPYDQLAAQCINGKALIKINLENGTIARADIPSNHLLIIRTDDFEKSIQQMLYSMKCGINQRINRILAFCLFAIGESHQQFIVLLFRLLNGLCITRNEAYTHFHLHRNAKLRLDGGELHVFLPCVTLSIDVPSVAYGLHIVFVARIAPLYIFTV